MKNENENYTCEIEVAASEIRYEFGQRGIQDLIDDFESYDIKITHVQSGLYNGDEEWTLVGKLENLKSALETFGWDLDQIEFEKEFEEE